MYRFHRISWHNIGGMYIISNLLSDAAVSRDNSTPASQVWTHLPVNNI